MSSILEPIFRYAGKLSLKQLLVLCTIVVVIIFAVIRTQSHTSPVEPALEPTLPHVTLTSLQAEAGANTISLIGTVRAEAEAAITAEVSGQVTSVPVTLGAVVQSGQLIATLENASERAAVTQAEGVYDSAMAAASQNNLSLDNAERALRDAKQQAITATRNAYTTVNSTVRNNIDKFFSQPTTSSVPGFRIDGDISYFNSTRVQLQTILPEFETMTNQMTLDSDIESILATTKTHTNLVLHMVDSFLVAFDRTGNKNSDRFDMAAEKATFTSLRGNLISTLNTLENVENAIEAATISVQQAAQTTSGGANSSADAQIKQALGSLQAAKANLAKTILRSPITGTVTALDVRTGDFVNTGTTVATIANTNALEIVTFAGAGERAAFAVGDSVRINNTVEGRVAAISPAINETTGKTEIRIYTNSSELTNGDRVRIQTATDAVVDNNLSPFIPITAIKFTADAGVVLHVTADGTLQETPVTLGAIRADQVEIISGLSPTDTFVKDVRGLSAGDKVIVKN